MGKSVTHRIFGVGKIVSKRISTVASKEDIYIQVKFKDRSVEFHYPDAFEKFLKTSDKGLMEQFTEDIRLKKEEKVRKLLELQPGKLADQPSPSQPKQAARKVERSNIAFKCTYCDGGAVPGLTLGFNGICSDDQIAYNIEEKQHVWCSDGDSPCRKYLSGQISREELESQMEAGGKVCYESAMLRDWTAYAGYNQTGQNRGKPMTLKQVQANSLVVLTTREPDTTEDQRIIFGVFLVDDSYEGDNNEEGYVTTRSNWKIALSPEEAHKLPFWKYYANDNSPDKPHWGTGLFRYFPDEQAVQILQDIAEVKTKQSEKDFAQQFLEHYCTVNALDKSTIAPPAGALVRGNIL